ncbi:hypothetical protein [Haloarchaeobius sp. HME9146]|uniref:DUF7286 family protein n=1 Tax=Haloarchaeobius sp. HME9146 TaxID=2978732 RepID=UPI0021C07E66|nr:hypothetical protein [Haloarchaeobius sp. HME9146]MCT9095824.1 hypothetical protein [Haloarchaeobius sp. HME9146]
MRLADDERARVPFALVGVLLLVSSATLVGTLATRAPGGATPQADLAAERADTAVSTALRGAVRRASANAGANPVLSTADTPYGRILNDSAPFRDVLRLRIYRQVQTALSEVDVRVGDAHAMASLPLIADPTTARLAKHRVHLEQTGNGTMRVRIENVTVRVRVGGRVVAVEERTVRFTAATPVLLVHERVTDFEARLNRGPTEGPGFGRQFAARLYAWAWARGYVQYGTSTAGKQGQDGGVVSNVLSTSYVSLSANEAALATQKGSFGRPDDAGKRALGRARARILASEVIGQAQSVETGVSPEEWLDLVLGDPGGTLANAGPDIPAPTEPETTASDPVRVGVNESADDAFRDLLAESGDGSESDSLADIVRETYSADVSLRASVTRVAHEPEPEPESPGEGWELVGTKEFESAAVESGDATLPAPQHGLSRLQTYERVVNVTRTTRWHWRAANRSADLPWNASSPETRVTAVTHSSRFRVGLAVVATPSPGAAGPDRPIRGVFEQPGPLGGGNLVDVRAPAGDLVDSRGGPDALARRAVTADLDEGSTRLSGEPPAGIESFVYAGLPELRETVRNLSVERARGDLATTATPALGLANRIRERQAELVEAPARYDSVAERARTAVRVAYLDHVRAELRERADATARSRQGLGSVLGDYGLSLDSLAATMDAQERATVPESRSFGHGGPTGPVQLAVDGVPSYLVVNEVESHRAPAIRSSGFHPLAARNINLFTVPYGDAGDTVVDASTGDADTSTVDLRVATRALVAMEYASSLVEAEAANRKRAALETSVSDSLSGVQDRVAADLAAETDLNRPDAETAVAAALDRWPTTGTRAQAAVNGSLAPAVADTVLAQSPRPNTTRWRDELTVLARVSIRDAVRSETARTDEAAVADAVGFLRAKQDTLAKAANTAGAAEFDRGARASRYGNESKLSVFAGLPLVPFYSWVATANVWVVDVRGTYARFTVRARQGGPDDPGGSFVYSRDGGPVAVDLDGDGVRERLGRADRVTFENQVGVLVVVPPGKNGVGDFDGNMDERSPGWPCPGPTVWPPRESTNTTASTGCSKPLYRPTEASAHVPRTADGRVGAVAGRPRSRVR